MLDGLACALVGARLPWSATDLEGLRSISELINLVASIVGGAFDEHPLLSQGEQI